MLDKGTKTKDAAEIARLIESRGARLRCFSGNNSLVLSLDALSEDFNQMLALFADLIINPTFAQREFKKQKRRNLAKLKAQEDNIFESGKKLLKATLFQRHPFRFSVAGNKKSLRKLRRRDLINFYKEFCVGKNMVLAVFGDVDAREVRLKVEGLFAKLAPGNTPSITVAKEPRANAVRTVSKSLPKKQSLIMLGFLGTTVSDQDRYTLEVICQILSQASGRLFNQIRQKRGLAYALGAYQILGLDTGYLVIYVATTSENLKTVEKEILSQIRLLRQEPLSEKELGQAKRAILGRRMVNRQTNSACALESSLDELYRLGHNHYLEYPDQINHVEASDIIKCANKYFDPTNYATVIVGE
jgi:zinc protease